MAPESENIQLVAMDLVGNILLIDEFFGWR